MLILSLFIAGAFWCGLGVYAPGDAPAAAAASVGPVTLAGGGRSNTIEIEIEFLLTAIVFPVLGGVIYWVMKRHDRIDKAQEDGAQARLAMAKEFEAALRSVRKTAEDYDKRNLERFLEHREHMGEKYAARTDLSDLGARLEEKIARLNAEVDNNTKTIRRLEIAINRIVPAVPD